MLRPHLAAAGKQWMGHAGWFGASEAHLVAAGTCSGSGRIWPPIHLIHCWRINADLKKNPS